MKDYWAIRSKKYNKLQWVNNKTLLDELINFCDLKNNDKVLDAGCGTGTVSNLIADYVSRVYAVDKSRDMLSKINKHNNVRILCRDIETDIVAEEFFDKIIARMVFHHITNLPVVFDNCYKMLVPSGWLVIQEGGVMPKKDKAVFEWYSKMIALKEDRHNFTIEELRNYFKRAGFLNIDERVTIDRNFSINNWLDNSGQDKKILKKIYDLHYNASDEIKKYYNTRINGKEIIIDSPVFMIKGRK